MHIVKVKRNGKLDLFQTARINTPSARVPKSKRLTLKETIARAKRAKRDARLVQMY